MCVCGAIQTLVVRGIRSTGPGRRPHGVEDDVLFFRAFTADSRDTIAMLSLRYGDIKRTTMNEQCGTLRRQVWLSVRVITAAFLRRQHESYGTYARGRTPAVMQYIFIYTVYVDSSSCDDFRY